MLREFTKAIGRYSKGYAADLPGRAWKLIEESAGEKLEQFTRVKKHDYPNRDFKSAAHQKPDHGGKRMRGPGDNRKR